MRKMKKINGYLVVKFNDRERREWEQLGAYGVIDAELYTGTLAVDLGGMECDDAETLEIAVEQARGLESELDIEEPAVKVTIVTETDQESTEAEVNPQLLINGWEATLNDQVKSERTPDMNPVAARHELHGFKVALNRLGLLGSGECLVPPDAFSDEAASPLPREPEELLAYICDERCKERVPGRTQEELEAICAECAVERLANEGDDRDLHIHSAAVIDLNKLIRELRRAGDFQERRICNAEARVYLRALTTAKVITEGERAAFDAAIKDALKARPDTAAREQFENLTPELKGIVSQKLYTLGLALSGDCPDNDCRVFLNIFNMARELDATLDDVEEYAADVLRRELRKLYRELREMYVGNHAVKKYKEEMQV